MTTLTMKEENRLEVIHRVFRGEVTVYVPPVAAQGADPGRAVIASNLADKALKKTLQA